MSLRHHLDVCDVCYEGLVDEEPILYCDACAIAVHPGCYGNPLLYDVPAPGEPWTCDWCAHRARQGEVSSCLLCSQSGGALKRTTDGRWAHIHCALWVPEVFFRYSKGREPIDVTQTPPGRWKGTCFFCDVKNQGAYVSCSEAACKKEFHVSCGMENGVDFDYKETRSGPDIVWTLCESHYSKWNK